MGTVKSKKQCTEATAESIMSHCIHKKDHSAYNHSAQVTPTKDENCSRARANL